MKKAIYEYGAPLSRREKEYLVISDDKLEFGFSNVDNKYKESMDIYSISANLINVTNDILTVVRVGKLISYDDITPKRVNCKIVKENFIIIVHIQFF